MITIRHTHADGTLVEGTCKGDGTAAILKSHRFRWFPSIAKWGIAQSRDKLAQTGRIKVAADALRAAGFEVTVEVDETDRRSFADAEAERNERAEDRAERMAGYAANAQARSSAAYERAHQMADAIPFGQPMMPDHYSYNRDRNYRARIESTYRRSFAESDKAEHYAQRAQAAESHQQHRESVPTTLRRIKKLEAEQRDIQRRLDGYTSGRAPYVSEHAPASGAYRERLTVLAADIVEQLAYWRGVVAKAQESGVKVWTAADFTRGDYVHFLGSWYEVLRVNGKSLTIPAMINDGTFVKREGARCTWTDTIPYDKVRGRKSGTEVAEILVEAERREHDQAAQLA